MDNRESLNQAWAQLGRLFIPIGLMALTGCAPTAPRQAATGALSQGTTAVLTPAATASPAGSAAALSPAATASPISTQTAVPSPSPSPTEAYFVYVFPLQPPEVCDYVPGVLAHGYPADDIFAPEGTGFVAVTSGVVDFVSTEDLWDPATDDPATRGGLAVAIIGDDGVRYYGSHLSEVDASILEGVRVDAGQLLGKVGNTGSARGKDTHLHFGISHPTYPEDWHARRGEVDPFPYLQAWEIGIYIKPRLP